MAFDALFQPITLGRLTAKNRIMMTPHWAGIGGPESQLALDYVEERAKAGVGLVLANAPFVHHSTRPRRFVETGRAPDQPTPYLQRLAEIVHKEGALLAGIMLHTGHNSWSTETYKPSWAPSPIPSSYREMPIGISKAQIDELVEHYAKSALGAKRSGFDSILFQTSVDYLIGSFLNPALNTRTDEYGGPIENRARIAVEIAAAIRNLCGPEFSIAIRTSADHMMEGGFNPEDAARFARIMEGTGNIDYIAVMVGSYYNFMGVIPGMRMPFGNAQGPASQIKAAVNIPIIASGRMADPWLMNEIVASGRADMVAAAREFLADGEFVRKLQEGRPEDIRPCIHCNHCASRLMQRKEVQCIVNPAFGEEKRIGIDTLVPQGPAKKVVVVGGGPAGMEAARVAASRGHNVTLYEAGEQLGGLLAIGALAPHRERLGDYTAWQAGQLRKLEVEVHTRTAIEPGDPRLDGADVIIAATGSTASRAGLSPLEPGAPVAGTDQAHVLTSVEALLDPARCGARVLVYDEEATQVGPSVALHLARAGKAVTIATTAPQVGVPDLFFTTELQWVMKDLDEAGVQLAPMARLTAVRDGAADFVHVHSGRAWSAEFDSVVMVTNYDANDALPLALADAGLPVVAVGDAVAARRLQLAVYEGYMAGWRV